jgi:hypothetical protein
VTETGDWLSSRTVFSAVLPTSTAPKSKSFSDSRMNGYFPIARTSTTNAHVAPPSWKSCSGVTTHAAVATAHVASVGVNSQRTRAVWPGFRCPRFGSNVNGRSSRHSYSSATSPSFANSKSPRMSSFTAPYPRSQVFGSASESTGSGACVLTRNDPHPATLNSTKSSYCSRLIGRNVTSTGTLIPGLSLITSGNSISKYFVAGSLYFTLIALVETFLSTTDRTYVPPGSHCLHRSTSAQSSPQTRARSYRALCVFGSNVSNIVPGVAVAPRALVDAVEVIVTAAPRPIARVRARLRTPHTDGVASRHPPPASPTRAKRTFAVQEPSSDRRLPAARPRAPSAARREIDRVDFLLVLERLFRVFPLGLSISH